MDRPDRRFDRSAPSLALDLAAALQELPIRLYELDSSAFLRTNEAGPRGPLVDMPLSGHYGLKETEQAAGQCFGGETGL